MRIYIGSLAMAAAIAFASPASSAIVSVLGLDSSLGTAAAIIAAPMNVLDTTVFNTGMQGFDEQQNVVLISDLAVDGGFILAGTRVNSQMIFMNREGPITDTSLPALTHNENMILGVMSDVDGTLEALSNAFLGASGTNYPGSFANRGLEGTDSYSASGNVLSVDLRVTQPGDWIRVITVSAVPVPAALPLFGTGLAFLGYAGWRRKKRRAAIAA